MLLKGKYVAQVVSHKIGTASTGTEQIELEFFVPLENDNVRAFLYFSEKAWQRSVEALKVCGWDGVDFATLDGLGSTEVEIVVDEEVYEGKVRYKVKWINPSGGGGSPGMEEGAARAFAAKMNARVKSLAPSKGKSAKPVPKKGGEDDGDLPF